jgi:hypothetical protein
VSAAARAIAGACETGEVASPLTVPDWTDHNVHDPGVTMLELLTWSVAALSFGLGVYAYVRARRGRRKRWPP